MTETLEQVIYEILEDIENEVDSLVDELEFSHTINRLISSPQESLSATYKTISCTKYASYASSLDEKINVYIDSLNEELNEQVQYFKDVKQHFNYDRTLFLLKNKVISYSSDDDFEGFLNKNNHLFNSYLMEDMPLSPDDDPSVALFNLQRDLFGCVKQVDYFENDFPFVKKELLSYKSSLNLLSSELFSLQKKLHFISDFQKKSYLSSQSDIDALCINLFDNDISSISVFYKKLSALEQPLILKQEESFLTDSKNNESLSKKLACSLSNSSTSLINSSYEENSYVQSDINLFTDLGIKSSRAKMLIDKKDFPFIKRFIGELNNYFDLAGFTSQESTKEVSTICSNYSFLSNLSRESGLEYLQAIDDLFSLYPSKKDFPTGLLPSYNKQTYLSCEAIRNTIGKENLIPVNFSGLDVILKLDHKNIFTKQAKQQPYNFGRHIAKTSLNGESYLYNACVKEVGHEGHFRRKGFGHNHRILFEVIDNKEKNTYDLVVFKYFTDHSSYTKFFNK